MRAVRVHRFGSLRDITIDAIAKPAPESDQVLVRVVSAALNPIDYKVALTGHRGSRSLPLTLGFDGVGIVEAIGSGITSVAVGERVVTMTDIMDPGTAADFVLVRERNLAHVSADVPDSVASGLPLAGLTALQAWNLAGVEEGQSVLVLGGAGGVGHLAIQLAKLRGATVYATASKGNMAILGDLGADHPVDYEETSPRSIAGHVDAVLDTRGGVVASQALNAMRPGSTLVSIVGFQPEVGEERNDVRCERMLVEPRADELKGLVQLVTDHRLRVIVHDITPLEHFIDAIEDLYTGHTVGKRIISVS